MRQRVRCERMRGEGVRGGSEQGQAPAAGEPPAVQDPVEIRVRTADRPCPTLPDTVRCGGHSEVTADSGRPPPGSERTDIEYTQRAGGTKPGQIRRIPVPVDDSIVLERLRQGAGDVGCAVPDPVPGVLTARIRVRIEPQ